MTRRLLSKSMDDDKSFAQMFGSEFQVKRLVLNKAGQLWAIVYDGYLETFVGYREENYVLSYGEIGVYDPDIDVVLRYVRSGDSY